MISHILIADRYSCRHLYADVIGLPIDDDNIKIEAGIVVGYVRLSGPFKIRTVRVPYG